MIYYLAAQCAYRKDDYFLEQMQNFDRIMITILFQQGLQGHLVSFFDIHGLGSQPLITDMSIYILCNIAYGNL